MDRKKIKIIRIINRFNLGGPTYNATFLTRFLSDEFETILVGGVHDLGEKDSLHILEAYGVTPIIIPEMKRSPNVLQDRKAYKKIKEIIRVEQPDIVHTHASKAGFLGRRAAFSCGVKNVVHTFHGHVFHSYFGNLKTKVVKQLERNLAKRSTGIIAISKLQKKELVSEHKITTAEKVTVIPLGFDLKKFTTNKEKSREEVRAKYGIKEDEVAIAIIGRLAPVKAHDYFLSVIERLIEKTSKKIKVFIVGDGERYDSIKKGVDLINENHAQTITMTSWILDIAHFNHGMDLICLTSKNEGTPVSLIEAQAAGKPVISTDVGGVKDIVADGVSGYVIKKEDIETYVKKLRLLVENDEDRLIFGKNAVNNVLDKFSYERLVKDMEQYYNKILGTK